MDVARRRMAIGIFAKGEDVEAIIGRFGTLGISHHECFSLTPGHEPSEQELYGSRQDAIALPALAGSRVMLRVYLDTLADEQVVAKILLESAAQSVQLHDVASG